MAKDAYYFSHDNNARNDPKCSALICDYGFEGYGVYWAIIEILAEQESYKLRKFNKLYDGLARQLFLDADRLRSIIEAMLHEYELLVEDENFIWSASLLRRMEVKELKRQSKVAAGRKGGIKSGISRSREADAKQNEAPLEANEPKEIGKEIGKENKRNTYTSDFETFWTIYKRNDGKKDAYAKWKICLKEFTAEQIIHAAKNYMAKCEKDKTETQFIKQAKTFLGPGGHIAEYLEQEPVIERRTGVPPSESILGERAREEPWM